MKAHSHNSHARQFSPVLWNDPSLNRRPYPTCSYCGSIHPADLALAIKQSGVTLEWADRKYGWPHKVYVHGGQIDWAKFYTEHLQDAEPGDKLAIERAMGLTFTFGQDSSVRWSAFVEPPVLDDDLS